MRQANPGPCSLAIGEDRLHVAAYDFPGEVATCAGRERVYVQDRPAFGAHYGVVDFRRAFGNVFVAIEHLVHPSAVIGCGEVSITVADIKALWGALRAAH